MGTGRQPWLAGKRHDPSVRTGLVLPLLIRLMMAGGVLAVSGPSVATASAQVPPGGASVAAAATEPDHQAVSTVESTHRANPDPSDIPADPDRARVQRQIERGDDLGSSARRVLLKARLKQDEGDFAGAARLMSDWLDGKPQHEHHLLRFNLAVSYTGLDNNEQALASLRLAVSQEPRFARAWLRLGEVAYQAGLYAEAADAFARGWELSPRRYPELLYYCGASRLLADQPAEALDVLERLLDRDPAAAKLEWYQALVAAATAAGKPERAADRLDQLLDLHPADATAWELAYRFAAGREDYRQAAIFLTVAGYLRPLDRGELVQLGDLYAVIGVPLQAARYYARALALTGKETGTDVGPGRSELRERRIDSLLAAHEYDQARTVLEEALAGGEGAGGDSGEASDEIPAATSDQARTARLWARLGDLEYQQGNWAAALAAFTRSTDLDPQFGRGWLMMGYCAGELGRLEEAGRYRDRAAEFR